MAVKFRYLASVGGRSPLAAVLIPFIFLFLATDEIGSIVNLSVKERQTEILARFICSYDFKPDFCSFS